MQPPSVTAYLRVSQFCLQYKKMPVAAIHIHAITQPPPCLIDDTAMLQLMSGSVLLHVDWFAQSTFLLF